MIVVDADEIAQRSVIIHGVKDDVRYWVNQVHRCGAWLINVEEKRA